MSHRLALETWGLCTYRHHTHRHPGHCRSDHLMLYMEQCPENSHMHCQCNWDSIHTHDTCKHHFLQRKTSFFKIMVKRTITAIIHKLKTRHNIEESRSHGRPALTAAPFSFCVFTRCLLTSTD